MTKEKFERLKAYYSNMKGRDITDREMVMDDITELIEALEQAWKERDTIQAMYNIQLTVAIPAHMSPTPPQPLDNYITGVIKERDEALMENRRLTKLLGEKEIVARRPPRASGCEVVSRSYLKAVQAEIAALRAHKEESGAVAVALQKSNALLRHAAPLIYRRHTMTSGSLGMAECDAACKAAGLDVWRWPTTDVKVAIPLEPIEVLRAVEASLVEASNLLLDERLDGHDRYGLLEDAIDKALREVQDWWKEEAEK